jgi:hypothetical protein
LTSTDRAATRRCAQAMMTIVKFDKAALEKAFKGA